MPNSLWNAAWSLLRSYSARTRRYFVNSPHFGLPESVQIEVTTKCNLRCKGCERNKDKTKNGNSDMPLNLYKSIVGKLRYPTRNINIVGLGEPLLHPEIFSMIGFAKEKGFEVSLIDNFTLVNKDASAAFIDLGLDYLYVSFDSVSKETFEEIRTGACFEKVIENIKLIVKTKKETKAKKPVLLFKSTISQSNYEEIPKLIKLAESLGADGINFGKLMSEYDSCPTEPPLFLSEADLPKSKITIYPCELSKSYRCDAALGCYVTFDGKVLPCGLMAESVPRGQYNQVQLGDLHSNTLADIWRSPTYRQFRKRIKAEQYLPQCRGCAGNENEKKRFAN